MALILQSFLHLLCLISSSFPSINNEDEPQHNLYVKEHQHFIKEREKALKNYKTEVQCANCSCYDHVIDEDLKPFAKGISIDLLRSSYSKGTKYQVINNLLYRTKDCLFPARCEGVDYFLNKIRKDLPNIEFIVNFHDWPQVSRHFSSPLPIFSFSKSGEYYDIHYPAWSFWKGGPAINIYPKGIGRWDLHRKTIIDTSKKWPWKKKLNKAFFRGSRTSSERDNLILLSRTSPDLVDASYTKNQAWKSEKDTLGAPPSKEVPLEDHCQYRFLFNFRGVAASFRLKYLFLCKSLVLHVGDEWKEFYYYNLKPWIHYVPVPSSYSQEEYRLLLTFLREEDELAHDIAKRGFNFINKYLKIDDVVCYWKKLLLQYHSLLNFEPELDDNLINVST